MKSDSETSRIKSMTGFASVQGAFSDWIWTTDIRAVNGRGLDLRFRTPDLEGLEPELRKRAQAKLARGNVTIQIKLQRDDVAPGAAISEAGLSAALTLLSDVRERAQSAGLDVAPVTATEIANMRGVLETSDQTVNDASALRSAVAESFDACLTAFEADRAREGLALAHVLSEQIDGIERLAEAALAAVGDREVAQKAGMERALRRLLDVSELPDEARLQQELALIVVKTDVTEELDRLHAHVQAARGLLAADGPVGRKLDFLMQEFNREANTLCAKSQATELTRIGLDLKTVIDQMREQVQNIE